MYTDDYLDNMYDQIREIKTLVSELGEFDHVGYSSWKRCFEQKKEPDIYLKDKPSYINFIQAQEVFKTYVKNKYKNLPRDFSLFDTFVDAFAKYTRGYYSPDGQNFFINEDTYLDVDEKYK